MFKVNIYTPTYHRLEMTKKSLESIIPHVRSSVYNTTLHICDNKSSPEMITWLESIVEGRVRLYKSDKNVGKAAIINAVYDRTSECSHFISIDSDMIADEKENFIDQLVWCSEHFTDFGLLSTFQKENNQQIWEGLNTKTTKENHTVSFGKYNNVAGGCVILKKEMWDAIGHYSTFGGVYGFDDGLMMQSVHLKNKLVGVVDTIRLTHPFDDDKKYQEWKAKNIAQRKQEGFYDC